MIGNPPYIKEYENRAAFNNFREVSPYYMGKMDIWYGFACNSIDMLCKKGILCFIATNNWVTNKGAKIMRNKVISDTRILEMTDFGSYMVFEESASVQTMIMLFQKDKITNNYRFDYRLLTKEKADKENAFNLLYKRQKDAIYLSPTVVREMLSNCLLTFSSSDKDKVLSKMIKEADFLQKKELAQGIVFPQDFLNRKGASVLGEDFHVGDGIFGLSDMELHKLNLSDKEKELIKPYYTSAQIHRYITDPQNTLWMIYTDSKYKRHNSLDEYPTIKRHLDRFSSIFTSDNKPYGLHRARNKAFFEGEKIISLRKCPDHPTFSYSDFPVYITQTFYSIKSSRYNMRYLTGLLNSKLIEFWLRHKGKMQGANFQVDKEPLLQIPIKTEQPYENRIVQLIDSIILIKQSNPSADTSTEECEIDRLIYKLYDLTYDEVRIVDPETPITREIYNGD